jgi:methyl-accepting chemotaxis protein
VKDRLETILRHSGRLNQLVAEIADPCRQQSAGVREIDVLGQIKTAAGATSGQAEQSAQSSAQLDAEARRLNQLADQLSLAIDGRP